MALGRMDLIFIHARMKINAAYLQNMERNVALGLASLRRRWIEAALDRYLASFEQSVIDDAADERRKRW